MTLAFAAVPHFHLDGSWADRLLLADGESWRRASEGESSALVVEPRTKEELAACVGLFVLPAHLRASFWAMLERQAATGGGDFVAFAEEVGRLLAFKGLPAPEGVAFELVLRPDSGAFDGSELWAVVNMGEPALVAWPGLRLRLGAGEGCRLPRGTTCDVRPTTDEEPAVLLVVRWDTRAALGEVDRVV